MSQRTGQNGTITEDQKSIRWVNVKPYAMELLKTHLNGHTSGLIFQSKRKTALVNCVVLNKTFIRYSANSVWSVAVCTISGIIE